MWRQERSGLSAPRTFQPQGGIKQKKHVKKREILAFKPLLQEIWLKNLTSRKIFWKNNTEVYQNGAKLNYIHPPMVL